MSGLKIIEGAEEALAFARGEAPTARLVVNGHAYVPEAWLPEPVKDLTELLRVIIQTTKPGNRTIDEMVRDLDQACLNARAALSVVTKPRQVGA